MKKYLLLFLLLFAKAEVQAQSLMTVGQIYDYDIGDIFIRTGGGIYSPPTYTTITITDKYFSATFDTVFYISNSTAYTPPGCASCVATYDTTYNDTISYTNLNDTVGSGLGSKIHYWYINCIDTAGYTGIWVDTVYYDTSFCAKLTTKISRMDNGPFLTDSCYWYFEPYWGYDEYGEGVGIRSHYYNICSQGAFFCEEVGGLLFYKKGIDSCGFRPMIPLPNSVMEYASSKLFKINPNPLAYQTQITFSEEQINSLLTVSNILGEKLQEFSFSGKLLVLDCGKFSNGLYFLSVSNSRGKFTLKIIVER